MTGLAVGCLDKALTWQDVAALVATMVFVAVIVWLFGR